MVIVSTTVSGGSEKFSDDKNSPIHSQKQKANYQAFVWAQFEVKVKLQLGNLLLACYSLAGYLPGIAAGALVKKIKRVNICTPTVHLLYTYCTPAYTYLAPVGENMRLNMY